MEYGLPGAAKNTGDESRLLLFTLPWRGRVDCLSGSESSRGGVSFVYVAFTPPRSLLLATLPLQGRVSTGQAAP